MDEPKHAQRRIGQRGKRFRQARPLGVVTVFVPPAILDEVQAIFHLPMAPDVGVKLGRRDRTRVEAGYEVPAILKQ